MIGFKLHECQVLEKQINFNAKTLHKKHGLQPMHNGGSG